MDLQIKDIAGLLNVSEKKIRRWIEEKNMPAHKIKNQFYFNKAEINEWILENNIAVSSDILNNLSLTQTPVSIIHLIKNGGIYYDLPGSSVEEAINNIAATIKIPSGTTNENVRIALLQREEMMSTAVGSGIAFPHPRNPIISDVNNEGISLCFLSKSIDFHALDGLPVSIIFVIISSNSKRHLEILSKLSFLCRQDDFIKILQERPQAQIIHNYIERKETEWSR